MDLFVSLAVFIVAVGILRFISSPATGRGLDLFASGFLPYRARMDWPRGVQEEEPVPWTWSGGGRPDQPEFHELSGEGAPAASVVDRPLIDRGMARRRH